MVHYVDTLVAVVRYQYVKKLGEEVGAELDVTMIESPELTTRIVSAYPHLKKIEKMDPKDFKSELAATKLQNTWMRKVAGKKIKMKRPSVPRNETMHSECVGNEWDDGIPRSQWPLWKLWELVMRM